MTSAFVHCRGGRVMEFTEEDDADPEVLFHTSRYGTRYALIPEEDLLLPMWVGRFHSRARGKTFWSHVMKLLRVNKIVLPRGQVYYPKGEPCR